MKIVKIKLNDLVLDEDIYPRKTVSQKTVEWYVEVLRSGGGFPPIEVQKVKEEGKVKTIILDGYHRILAFKEFNRQVKDKKLNSYIEGEEEQSEMFLQPIEEVDCFYWKDEILDKKENLEALRIEATKRNIKHGKRLSLEDLKHQALRIVQDRPIDRLEGIITELAKKFEVSKQLMSQLIGEEVRKRRLSRNVQIIHLSMLGWTNEEIGKLFGLTEGGIRKIRTNFTSKKSTIQDQFYKERKSVDEIAQFFNLDIVTTWGIILEGKDDLERFKLFGKNEYRDKSPMLYNVWNLPQRDPRLGREHPGNIPGQIAMNILYYYTEQGDMVVDPMAGGGSTIDACLVMGRRCRAYDIEPVRYDIIKHDLWNGFPKKTEGCNLVFLDPPYWNLLQGFYSKESISEKPYDVWLKFMELVAKESYRVLKKGGHVALVLEALEDERGTGEFYDLPFECHVLFKEVGFKEVQRISAPIPTQVKSARDVELIAKKKKKMLSINRDVIVYRKV